MPFPEVFFVVGPADIIQPDAQGQSDAKHWQPGDAPQLDGAGQWPRRRSGSGGLPGRASGGCTLRSTARSAA